MKLILLSVLAAMNLWGQITFPSGVYNPLLAKDNIQTSLIAPMAVSDNVAVVQSGAGWAPQMVAYICDSSSGSPAKCTSYEVMLVTSVSGNVLTVTRAYGGSTAKSHASGKLIQNAYTAVYTNSAQNEIQAMQMFGGSGRYVDLRAYGAICDGTTNVQPAASAALAAGYKHLFLPKNCFWIPTGNTLPNGISVLGEDLATSKIWPSNPTSLFVNIGTSSELRNVNLNGPICHTKELGCGVYFYANNDPTNIQPIQNNNSSQIVIDTGGTTATTNPSDMNDANGISVIERGQGGGIYGQYNGGVGASSGSGIQSFQASDSNSSAGLRSTKGAAGPGFVIDTAPGGETGNDIAYTTGIKTSGTILTFFQGASAFNGNMIGANLGFGTGTFTGNFFDFSLNSTRKFVLNSAGAIEAAGYINSGPTNYIASETGSNNAIAGTLSGAPLLAEGMTVSIKLAHTLQAGANTFAYAGGAAAAIKSSRNPSNNIGTAYAVGGVVTLKYSASTWQDISQ